MFSEQIHLNTTNKNVGADVVTHFCVTLRSFAEVSAAIMDTVALRMQVLSDQYLVVEKCPDFAELSVMREEILSFKNNVQIYFRLEHSH